MLEDGTFTVINTFLIEFAHTDQVQRGKFGQKTQGYMLKINNFVKFTLFSN